jgi:hypothetical protein
MVLFNPLPYAITRTLEIPVYYTGQQEALKIREQEGPVKAYKVSRNYTVSLTVKLAANGYSWWVIE